MEKLWLSKESAKKYYSNLLKTLRYDREPVIKISEYLHDLEHGILLEITGKKEYFEQSNWLRDNQYRMDRGKESGFIPPELVSDIENLKKWRNAAVHKNIMTFNKYMHHSETMAETINFFSKEPIPIEIKNIFDNPTQNIDNVNIQNEKNKPRTKIKKKKSVIPTDLNYSIQKLSWQEFVEKIKNERHFTRRIEVIKIAKELFKKYNTYSEMKDYDRKFIAGLGYKNEPNEIITKDNDWLLFGSMNGAGKFKHEIIENNKNISLALDQIPLNGSISKDNYSKFWDYYYKVFNSDTYIATATRLLCMKRPDTFICLDSANKNKLCKYFEIRQRVDKDSYWDEVIIRIINCEWWKTNKPNNEIENDIWNARAAFIDSLVYDG